MSGEMRKSATGAKRILVVEDEPAISQVCLRALTGEGFEVDIATNGKAAQDMLAGQDYNLCLIDIRTPIMNGKELFQFIIKKYPKLTDGVIFTTGDMLDGYTQRFLELAGRPYLPKPFTPDELKSIFRDTLRRIEK